MLNVIDWWNDLWRTPPDPLRIIEDKVDQICILENDQVNMINHIKALEQRIFALRNLIQDLEERVSKLENKDVRNQNIF